MSQVRGRREAAVRCSTVWCLASVPWAVLLCQGSPGMWEPLWRSLPVAHPVPWPCSVLGPAKASVRVCCPPRRAGQPEQHPRAF